MGYKPSIVERMNRGLNFQKKNSLLKKSSPLRDTDPHTGEGGHSHAGNTAGSSTFSNVLPSGTRSTFQGSTTATFDPSTVQTQKHITGKNYLESTEASRAAYNALSDEEKAKQDREALALQAKENLRVQNVNNAIDIANQETLKEAEQEFNVNQQNLATSQEFTSGEATEAQMQQTQFDRMDTRESERDVIRTRALENAGVVFTSVFNDLMNEGGITKDEAIEKASSKANHYLKNVKYVTADRYRRGQEIRGTDVYPYEVPEGAQILDATRHEFHGYEDLFTSNPFEELGGANWMTHATRKRFFDDEGIAGNASGREYAYDDFKTQPEDFYGINRTYTDNKGRVIDYDKYKKLQKRGKGNMSITYGPELQRILNEMNNR